MLKELYLEVKKMERLAPHPEKGKAISEAVELMAKLNILCSDHPDQAERIKELEVRLLNAHPNCE